MKWVVGIEPVCCCWVAPLVVLALVLDSTVMGFLKLRIGLKQGNWGSKRPACGSHLSGSPTACYSSVFQPALPTGACCLLGAQTLQETVCLVVSAASRPEPTAVFTVITQPASSGGPGLPGAASCQHTSTWWWWSPLDTQDGYPREAVQSRMPGAAFCPARCVAGGSPSVDLSSSVLGCLI